MNKINIPISGMHCKSCEMLVEDNLKEVSGVKSCAVSCKSGGADIEYEGEAPKLDDLKKAITDAGYQPGEVKKDEPQEASLKPASEDNKVERAGFISKNSDDYFQLSMAIFAVVVIYLLLDKTGLLSMGVSSNLSPASLGVVVLVGLTAGISTCMALVGGLVLGLSAKYAESHPDSSSLQKFRPHLFFNFGRVVGFGLLGGLLGYFGSLLELSSLFNGVMTIAVGILMFVLGLQLIDIFPWVKEINFTLPKSIGRFLGVKKENEYSHRGSIILGALTFFLPCGFTQTMQVMALGSGSFSQGAAIMALFALGTAPGLLGVAGLTSLIKGKYSKLFFRFAGVAVIFLAMFNAANGAKLVGLNYSGTVDQEKITSSDPNVVIENGVQVVRMTEDYDGYSPNKFTIRKDLPVKWIIDAKAPNSCASALIVPKLKIRKFLKAGENIIEFTPTEAGKLPFSCSMGMYTGVFNVVDGNRADAGIISGAEASVEDVTIEEVVASTCNHGGAGGAAGTCGGSCGGSCGCGKK